MYFWKNYEVREEVAKIIKVGSILPNENPEIKGQFLFDENSSNAQYAYIDSTKMELMSLIILLLLILYLKRSSNQRMLLFYLFHERTKKHFPLLPFF